MPFEKDCVEQSEELGLLLDALGDARWQGEVRMASREDSDGGIG